MSADPTADLWDALQRHDVRGVAQQLTPNLRRYAPEPAADTLMYPCEVCGREESTHEVYDRASRRHIDVCASCGRSASVTRKS